MTAAAIAPIIKFMTLIRQRIVGGVAVLLSFNFLVMAKAGAAPARPDDVGATVIYGEDNRKDLHEVADTSWLDVAGSTVALFDSANIEIDAARTVARLTTRSFAEEYDLCPTEKFRDQRTGAFCSGSLVGPDLVLTAGHCIQSDEGCQGTSLVFSFGIQDAARGTPEAVHPDEVYACKEVVKSVLDDRTDSDWAVIRLDRPVTNHRPLAINRTGAGLDVDTEVTVIGHPSGLPTKLASGAKVRSREGAYFVSNLDTYAGNSGSAVFNSATKKIEGILVRGERDFTRKPGQLCFVSNICADDQCRGEDVTYASEAAEAIPELKRPIRRGGRQKPTSLGVAFSAEAE